jgi:hypothetical protein
MGMKSIYIIGIFILLLAIVGSAYTIVQRVPGSLNITEDLFVANNITGNKLCTLAGVCYLVGDLNNTASADLTSYQTQTNTWANISNLRTEMNLNINNNATSFSTLYLKNKTDATFSLLNVSSFSVLGSNVTVGDNSTNDYFINMKTSNNNKRGLNYYLADGTTLRGFMYWDLNEDLLIKGDSIYFQTADGTLMTLKETTKRVGINMPTTDPQFTLDVNGTVNAEEFNGSINSSNIKNTPAACAVSNSFMTQYSGASSTCTAVDFSSINASVIAMKNGTIMNDNSSCFTIKRGTVTLAIGDGC